MPKRATEGALLDELVSRSIPLCQRAEKASPRSGPGRKPIIPDWVLTVMIMVGVMLRKKTKSAQFVWWRHHSTDFARWLPGQKMPSRSTFYERYRRVHRLFRQAIVLQGKAAVAHGWANSECTAVDKSLMAGRGQPWKPADRRRNHVPRRVDTDTTWGYSDYHGWVQGYSFEVVVTAPQQGVIWPLVASVDTASRSEQKSILEKVPDLPATTKYVLADSGYDSNAVAEAVETSHPCRRRFLCPEVRRWQPARTRPLPSRQSQERQRHRRLRGVRRAFLKSHRGRSLYKRRKTTVEPFHAQLKHLFDLDHRVWHWGLANNRTMILAAICAYQLLLTHNHAKHRRVANLQCLLDAL
jgi:Transposase DDE domain